jgi:hypothetical protein
MNLATELLFRDTLRKYVARNPTPGTGLATIAAPTALADTSPFVVIKNGAAVDDGTRVSIDYIRLICTAAGTGGTSLRYDVKTDQGSTRLPTSGNTTLAVNPVNRDCGVQSITRIDAGALVAPAASDAKLVYGGLLKNAIPAAGDVYTLLFNDENPAVVNAIATQVMFAHGPLIIGPQQFALLHLWLPSQSAASSYEVEVGISER